MIDVATTAKSLYVGATVDVRRRWHGFPSRRKGGKRTDNKPCEGHYKKWEVMQIISVQRLGAGPAVEKKLIEFMMGYTVKTTNKAPDARGLPKHGTTYMYICYNRYKDNDPELMDLIE